MLEAAIYIFLTIIVITLNDVITIIDKEIMYLILFKIQEFYTESKCV